MNSYNELGKLFTRNSLSTLVFKNDTKLYDACAARYLDEKLLKSSTNAEVLRNLFEVLREGYRNEYYYKNTLLNLSINDSLTTTAIAEIAIAKSKVDMIIIDNEKASVYEIKSDLDSFQIREHSYM